MLYEQYYDKVKSLMDETFHKQKANIQSGARMMTECIMRGGLIYVFGCGHSHMIAEEMFYRAGGLVPISAILYEDLMLHQSAVGSSAIEQTEGITPSLLAEYHVTPNDLLLIVSTSGSNAAPVDLALHAKNQKIPLICIGSMVYSSLPARHSSGKKLSEIATLFLDNNVPIGDACAQVEGCEITTGPVSTFLSAMLANCMVVQTVENLQRNGIEPAIYHSGNVADGAVKNQRHIQTYRSRIRMLDPRSEDV